MITLLLIRFLLREEFSIKIAKFFKYLFLVLIAMLVSFSATPQVTADFTTITSTTGCGSLVVEFKDLSLGGPTSWLWDFGNGNTSTLQNPIAVYNLPGYYDVMLKVSNGITTDTTIFSSYIKVYEEPIAAIQVNSVVSGCMPLGISFEDISIANTSIVSWVWDFGDGGSSNFQNPDYIYPNQGIYSVSLSIEDTNGCQDLITEFDLIEVNISPTADFTPDIIFSCDSLELVSFSNTSINSSIFIWDFGDGTTTNTTDPSHIFSQGIYTVTLYAKEGSCLDTLIRTDLIEIFGSSLPDFSVSVNSGCEGLSVYFSDLTTNNPNTFLWDFGDGGTSILQDPIHIFDSAGVFDITLTTSTSGQCATTVNFPDEIEVFPTPIIDFVSDTNLGCSIPFAVTFSDNTIDAVMWSWDFGNGNVSNLQNPLNTYNSSGVFDVILSVVNNDGCISSVAFSDYIRVEESPTVNLSATPIVSCVGEDISFANISSIDITEWNWDFGDGFNSNNQDPIHQYGNPGIYDVGLIAGTSFCKDTLVVFDYIEIVEPAADFDEIYNCDNPLVVEFENSSIGADDVFWDFGDGGTSTLINPIHNYSSLGIYIVSLSVVNHLTGCTDTLTKEIKITQPIAQFDYFINSSGIEVSDRCVPHRMYIENQSQDYAFLTTIWGDGGISHGVSHTYTTPGIFDVTLIVSDLHFCTDTMTIQNMFNMHDVTANFGIVNRIGCDSLLVEFEDISTSPSASVRWEFGDGESSTIDNPQHIYNNEGVYDVTLYIKSIDGCLDTLQKIEYINFQHPSADFIVEIQDVCLDDEVQFLNLSEGVGVNSNWDFGDGTSSNIFSPIHSYSFNGLYDVNLLITDSFNCTDQLSLTNYIEVLSPTANFSSSALSSNCPPVISNFTNLSSSDVTSFEWNFGDGSTSLVQNPSHLFSNSGVFDVSLIVDNSFGCKDTLLLDNYISVLGVVPSGSFMISDTLVCKGDIVLFNPLVNNTDNFLWDFGNGLVSNDTVASVLYSDTGVFIPSLIIDNIFGCQSVITNDNTIRVSEVIIEAGIDVQICEGESVELNGVGNATLFSWSPSNTLSSSNINNPVASPITDGFYYVYHSNGICDAIDSVFIEVNNDIPIADFTASNFCAGDTTYFVANSGLATGNFSYLWSFGSNSQIASTLLSVDSNNITLIIENLDNSCKDTLEEIVTIFSKPGADFVVADACLGDTLEFFDNSSSSVIEWFYNFGDTVGSSFDQNPIYTYVEPGIYNVTLNVASDMGCEETISKDVIVKELPLVDFDIDSQCEGEGNIFRDLSYLLNGDVIFLEYDFNDGFFSNDSVVAHVFNGYGFFDVSLTVTGVNGCSNSIVKIAEVFQNPIVDFVVSELCEGSQTIFNDSSSITNGNIVSYYWNFGAEGVATTQDALYSFVSDGIYNVSLSVASDKGCESKLDRELMINKIPSANFQLISEICLGDEVKISYLPGADNPAIGSWHYNFGDGSFSNSEDPLHIYAAANIFDVSLEVISLEGCKNDTVIPDIIKVHNLPIADFQPSVLSSSVLSPEINFYNYSEGAIFFQWDFDNGEYSFENSPSCSFNEAGIYNISLLSTNEFGCTSEAIKKVYITPDFTFFIPDAFTPNSDGLNDLFIVEGNGFSSFEIEIFDRWGGVVFESSNIDFSWNGNHSSGEQLGSGIYLYHIAVYDLNERLWVYNGELKLMR